MGDNPNFVAPTPPTGDSSKRIANTEFVAGALSFANISGTATFSQLPANDPIAAIVYVIDGGGSAISTGVKGDLEIPFGCTINRATLLADQTGSAIIDIWKNTYANFPPTVGSSITASALPTLAAASKAQDSTLSGWSTSIAAGDTLRFNVNTAVVVTRVTLSLKVTKT